MRVFPFARHASERRRRTWIGTPLSARKSEQNSSHPDVRDHNLHAVLDSHASPKSHFMTDEAHAFKEIGWNFASHRVVTHSKDEYVRRDGHWLVTTNAVEGFFSILKREIYGVYQHVS
jgi:ISXO2-like transposase domain